MKIPEEPAVTDLPSSPSEAFALGWRMAWGEHFAIIEREWQNSSAMLTDEQLQRIEFELSCDDQP